MFAHVLLLLTFKILVACPSVAQEGIFLKETEIPRAVFPDADRFDRSEITPTEEIKSRIRAALGSAPSVWESSYPVYLAWHGSTALGRAFVVEEIGKHRPITFVIGVTGDGKVADVAVVAYREAYGGEIASKRFLKQYRDKQADDSLQRDHGISNIAGATLSVDAAGRAVKKALALAQIQAAAPHDGSFDAPH